MNIIRQCPACRTVAEVETTMAVRVAGRDTEGRLVLEQVWVYACTACEWIRTVRAVEWELTQHAMGRKGATQ